MEAMDIAALVGAFMAVACAIAGLVVFVARVAVTAGKILQEMMGQRAALQEHGAALKRHEDILTNGLRAGVRDNTQSIQNVERRLDEIGARLGTLPCTPPVPRCRPAAPQQNRKGSKS